MDGGERGAGGEKQTVTVLKPKTPTISVNPRTSDGDKRSDEYLGSLGIETLGVAHWWVTRSVAIYRLSSGDHGWQEWGTARNRHV